MPTVKTNLRWGKFRAYLSNASLSIGSVSVLGDANKEVVYPIDLYTYYRSFQQLPWYQMSSRAFGNIVVLLL